MISSSCSSLHLRKIAELFDEEVKRADKADVSYISKANREALGVEIGDTVDATIALDEAARIVGLPDDALDKAKLHKRFDAHAASYRNRDRAESAQA